MLALPPISNSSKNPMNFQLYIQSLKKLDVQEVYLVEKYI